MKLSAYAVHKLIKKYVPFVQTYWETHEKARQIEFDFIQGDCNEKYKQSRQVPSEQCKLS